jgi:hypothetical protein
LLHIGVWMFLGLSFAGQNYFSAMALGHTAILSAENQIAAENTSRWQRQERPERRLPNRV